MNLFIPPVARLGLYVLSVLFVLSTGLGLYIWLAHYSMKSDVRLNVNIDVDVKITIGVKVEVVIEIVVVLTLFALAYLLTL